MGRGSNLIREGKSARRENGMINQQGFLVSSGRLDGRGTAVLAKL